MQWKRWILVGGIAVTATACPVLSTRPVGDEVPDEKLEDWAGTWALGNGEPAYLFEIDDAAQGTLKITGLGDEFKGLGDEFTGLGDEFKGLGDEFTGLGDEFTGLGDEFKGLGDEFTGLGDEPEHMTAFVRASGEDLFLSFVEESETLDASPVYTWALVEREDHRLVLWNPNYAKFVGLVVDGLLPGKLDDDGLTLGELSPEHMELLTSEDHGVLFEWRAPIVLWRRDPPETSP